jgi:hypothetical protein
MAERVTDLAERLRLATEGLVYQSETDAPVRPFVLAGYGARPVTGEALLAAIGRDASTPVETSDAKRFFAGLVTVEDWYGDDERRTAERYAVLEHLLDETLTGVTVVRVGRTQIDVYVVGTTPDGDLAGVVTRAVET